MSSFGALIYYWPHILAMIAIVIVVWRREIPNDWRIIGLVAVLAIVLTALYRSLDSGVAPPRSEPIGIGGWIGLVLTAGVPLIAVSVATGLVRASTMGVAPRIGIIVATGLVCLVLYPLVGMLLYGALTRVFP